MLSGLRRVTGTPPIEGGQSLAEEIDLLREEVQGGGLMGKKVYPLSTRVTLALRRKLELAAKLSGRSLAEEVEYRLLRSLGGV
jgi:hypothetical protein